MREDSDTPALAFYRYLESCAEWGEKPASESAHVRADAATCDYIAQVLAVDGQPIAKRVVRAAFYGLPVKQAFGVARGTAARIPDLMERDRMLRNYARSHGSHGTHGTHGEDRRSA